MTTTTVLDYLTAFGSLATPIVVLGLMAIGWRFRTRLQRRLDLEDKLREDRIGIYHSILEPFIILLMTDAAWQSDPKNKNKDKFDQATKRMLSLEYRQHGFRLSLMGSDAVVKSYNNLMQYFFQRTEVGEQDVRDIMGLLGNFLLEIRKSMGNETTRLDRFDMLEWFLTDARAYRARA